MNPASAPPLTVSHLTICGSMPRTPARERFDERVAAAAAAGFRSLSLTGAEFQRELDAGVSGATMQSIAHDHGVSVDEVEFLVDWTRDGDVGAASREREAILYEMADAFGATRMHVGEFDEVGPLPDFDSVAAHFAALCDRAAGHGLAVGLEYIPYSPIPDLGEAWRIVESAGRPNGGLVVDAWHHFRSGGTLASLGSVPADRIVSIQLSDAGPLEGDLREDTIRRRRLPGEGSFDLTGFVRTLVVEHGCAAPIDVEIVSDEQRARPLAAAAERAYSTTAALLARLDH